MWLAQREVGATVDEMADAFRQTPTPAGGVVGDRIDEHSARGVVSGLLDNDPEVFAPGEDALDAYDPKRPMKCPVYVLRADPAAGPPPIGGAFPPDFEEPFLATHPHATVEFVPGAGHGVHVQMPELFIDRLERFLGGLHD